MKGRKKGYDGVWGHPQIYQSLEGAPFEYQRRHRDDAAAILEAALGRTDLSRKLSFQTDLQLLPVHRVCVSPGLD